MNVLKKHLKSNLLLLLFHASRIFSVHISLVSLSSHDFSLNVAAFCGWSRIFK